MSLDNRAGNPFSSDDDEDDSEEEDDAEKDDGEDKDGEQKKKSEISKFKKGKIFKSLTNNWRSNRHEREQFINSQKVSITAL